MAIKLTDSIVKSLELPAKGNRIVYDKDVSGFGCRVTANGARAYILNYRTRNGRERRFTIGSCTEWTAKAARDEASSLKADIKLRGRDPIAELQTGRDAPTMAKLCERFAEEHLPKLRPRTREGYETLIRNEILPALKHIPVADVRHADIAALHRKITKRGASYPANRTVAVLSKMFSLARKWEWRAGDNPANGIERNPETKRTRYLSPEELGRLTKALSDFHDQSVANAVRLLLLTGARRNEVLGARWDQFDLAAGVWTKPGATTKQKTDHRVPLSAPAMQLLADMRAANPDGDYLFPGRGVPHRVTLKKEWASIRRAAGLEGVRLHDLRHTYASILASAGLSLPVIAALLGHTQTQTTARYAHLYDDPLRAATERVGAVITGKPSADVVPLKDSGR